MVDAYTWTRGSDIRTFTSRKELYEHMISVGDVIVEGDDAEKFSKHLEKSNNERATQARAKLANIKGE